MAASFQNIEISLRIDGHGTRVNQWSLSCIGTVQGDATLAIADDRCHDSAFQAHRPNPAVIKIRDVKIFLRPIKSDAVNISEFSLTSRTAIPTETSFACAGECKNLPVPRFDSADAIVPCIGDKNIAARTPRQTMHAVKAC